MFDNVTCIRVYNEDLQEYLPIVGISNFTGDALKIKTDSDP
jgi:hypothetical protein